MSQNQTSSKPESAEQPIEKGLDETACSASCFVAGIVKGLIESRDAYKHFGSLMAFKSHAKDALKCGVVEGDADNLRVTDYGRKAYAEWNISKEEGRSYMWRRKSFILPNKGD